MSATEIIERIKALSPEEQRQVFEFVKETKDDGATPSFRYASDEQARTATEAVVEQYPEVFRRLAQ